MVIFIIKSVNHHGYPLPETGFPAETGAPWQAGPSWTAMTIIDLDHVLPALPGIDFFQV
jgi:hypothetical protein